MEGCKPITGVTVSSATTLQTRTLHHSSSIKTGRCLWMWPNWVCAIDTHIKDALFICVQYAWWIWRAGWVSSNTTCAVSFTVFNFQRHWRMLMGTIPRCIGSDFCVTDRYSINLQFAWACLPSHCWCLDCLLDSGERGQFKSIFQDTW
jgi:hypothetical protein